jgi:subtilisin family serine protease
MKSHFLAAFVVGAASASTALAQHNASPWAEDVHRQWTSYLESHSDVTYDTSAILVRFSSDTSEAYRANVRALVGDGWLERYTLVPGLELVHVRGSVPDAIARVKPFVMYAEPNWVVHRASVPNDPSFGLEWGLRNTGQTVNGGDLGTAGADIRATQAWDIFTGDPNFVIADIDTGLQYTHPDIAANAWTNPGEIAGNGIDDDGDGFVDDVHGWDFYSNDNDPADQNGHGTHTAGTIGAVGNNGVGVSGVNWHCKIMAVRFLGPSGSGTLAGAVGAIQFCVTRGVKVSNNSWVGPFDQSESDAVSAARNAGHLMVCAAGNNGTNNDANPGSSYPASFDFDNIIAVAATNNDDGRASFSNYGATKVDLAAPGDNVYSTWQGSGYMYDSGTSMATPHVTGAVAMVWALNPSFTHQQVIYRILSTVRPLPSMSGQTLTGGILNLAEAIAPGSTQAGTPYCSANAGDPSVTTLCPCANQGAPGNGCRNSSVTAGARVLTSGVPALDNVVFTTFGETATATSIVLQGDTSAAIGVVFGDGIRCVDGNLKRLYLKTAVNGSITAPQGGDLSVKLQSAFLGDPIAPGSTRYYQVYYRDPNTVFCPDGFNATNAQAIHW